MTYQHALRYLSEEMPASATNDRLSLTDLRPILLAPSPILCICTTHDRQGSAAARYLSAILSAAGIDHLYWNDAADQPRERFMLSGTPLLTTALCEHAQAVRKEELRLLRESASPHTPLSPSERCAAVMLRCARANHCRVMIVEGGDRAAGTHTGAQLLRILQSDLPLIVIASTADEQHKAALSTVALGVRNVISAPCGDAGYRRLSDACAKVDGRLGLVALPRLHRENVTLGAQRLSYREWTDCRLQSGTLGAAYAAALALECVILLGKEGLAISDTDVRRALESTLLPRCAELISIAPLLVADEINTAAEWQQLLADINDLHALIPAPRRAIVAPSVRAYLDHSCTQFDQIIDDPTQILSAQGCTWVIGPQTFLQSVTQTATKK